MGVLWAAIVAEVAIVASLRHQDDVDARQGHAVALMQQRGRAGFHNLDPTQLYYRHTPRLNRTGSNGADRMNKCHLRMSQGPVICK